ncbi:galactose-1-phosphate uridylyltransferase [Halobacteriovorax marinus]|uniref:Galactose-1-phosphate uridylyltransferase n=1 Tax=Halobacteriovorax marinus TaxID=97084 RepID=A0A1Y5F981_9BACT|nr:galactose-1-phosphate uridylyltransferase [Halobacteriovorax marinus]
MSFFRKNLVTNDWVMFAPNRSARPKDFSEKENDQVAEILDRAEHVKGCPFCDGAGEDLLKLTKDPNFEVRTIANKYASLNRDAIPEKSFHHLHNEMINFGIHDVIIDTKKHNKTLALLSISELELLVMAYRQRFNQVDHMEHVRHVVIFKNQGHKAGGSLEHPHSQVYGLPVIPFQSRVRTHEMENYYHSHNSCLICDTLECEIKDQVRMVCENEEFAVFVPYASLSPYHLWIVPKTHNACFGDISDDQVKAMGDILKRTFHKCFYHLNNMDFNFIIQSLSHREKGLLHFHWYMSVIFHYKRRGGIEFAGGLFVNPLPPEEAAFNLRNIPDFDEEN